MVDRHVAYVARTPGHKCLRCGKDISNRVASVKYCYECKKAIDKENHVKRKIYVAELEQRDKAKQLTFTLVKGMPVYYCPVCLRGYENTSLLDTFCRQCGQRLREEE